MIYKRNSSRSSLFSIMLCFSALVAGQRFMTELPSDQKKPPAAASPVTRSTHTPPPKVPSTLYAVVAPGRP